MKKLKTKIYCVNCGTEVFSKKRLCISCNTSRFNKVNYTKLFQTSTKRKLQKYNEKWLKQ